MHQGADTFDGHLSERDASSLLDRPFSLTSISWFSLGWVAVAFVACVIRLVGYSALPLSGSEAGLASNAWAIVQGGGVPAAASVAPLPTQLTAFALFLLGASDGIVRLVPLVAGLGSIALIGWLRLWIGRGPALAAAAIAALSPTLVQASHGAGDGGLLVFSSLLTLIAGLSLLERRTAGYALLFGVAAAMTLMADPIGWLALPIVAIAIVNLSERRDLPARELPLALLGAAVTIALISTSLFVHPAGFSDFFRESLSALWERHLSTAGSAWHLALFQIVIDETVALLLAILAVVYALRAGRDRLQDDRTVPALLLWTGLSLLVASILGGQDVSLYTLTVLPLILLAGTSLDMLVHEIRWNDVIEARGALFLIAVPITLFAGLSTYGLLTSDTGTGKMAWVLSFVLVGLVIFAPLLALCIWLGRSLSGRALPLVAILAVVLLAGVGIRGSVLLNDQLGDRPGEPLTVGNSAPAVGLTVDQIVRLSRDMTTFDQDARDPTGGHGLSIVIDSTIEQPFRWYFRDFPNVTVNSPDEVIRPAQAPQVLIAAAGHESMLASTSGRLQRTMPLASTTPAAISDPDWGGLIGSLIRPGQWQRFSAFLIDRKAQQPAPPAEFTISLRQDVVNQMYGAMPPAGG